MTLTLTPIDWIIIAAYMIGCIVAGVWMRRYVRNVDDFAVAGREMEANLGVASLAATELGIVTVMYTAEMGFTNGPAGATYGVLSAAAMLAVGITGFVIVPMRNAGVMTIPELFEKRFGKHVRWLAGLVVIVGGVLNMGVFLRAGGDFLMNIAGMDSAARFPVNFLGVQLTLGYIEMMMTGLLAIVLLYTALGGMISVLVTDYLQFLVMGLGIVVTSLLVAHALGWWDVMPQLAAAHQAGQQYEDAAKKEQERLDAEVKRIAQSEGPQAALAFKEAQVAKRGEQLKAAAGELVKQKVLVSVKRPKTEGAPAEPPKALTMAEPFNPTKSKGLGWGWVIWQALTALAVVTTWQTTIARVLAAKDSQTAKRVYRRTWFYFVGRWCLPGLWGAAAFLYFTNQPGGLPEGLDSQTAMPRFLGIVLAGSVTGFLGLMIAAMLAAEMSTDSGYLLTWATVIYNDLIGPCLRRPLSERAKLRVVRALVLAIGLFLVFWGLWYQPPGSIWEYLAITGNIYLASLFALLVGALYWRGANHWGAMAAILLGAAGPITFLIVNYVVGPDSPYRIPGEVSGLAAFGLAFAGLIVGSLVGKAASRSGGGPASPSAPGPTA